MASKIGANPISLGELIEKEKLYGTVDKKRNTLVADLKRISECIKEIMNTTKGRLLIEGHFAPDAVPPEEVDRVLVLRRDPEELKRILTARGYGQEKVNENVAAEILDVCLYDAVMRCGSDKVCEVDVTGRRVEDVVEEVLLILDGHKEPRIGIVDWLGKLESEGRLEEYLKTL